ncbi:hypothetical protein OU426_10145 [Frigidibacter sp. RF13]|nr:hypothetical protein [Frigidibacter sp. RF13]
MRAITSSDVDLLALALLASAPVGWPTVLQFHMDQVKAADLHRKRTGRLHPRWGNGGLASALVGGDISAPPDKDDALYCAALLAVRHGILEWRTRQNVKWPAARLPFSPRTLSATLRRRSQGDADG